MAWTKEEKNAYNKAYYEKNKEKVLAKTKEYQEKNREKIAARSKEYRQTPNGKKINRIKRWKQQGILSDDWDSLYDRYLDCKFCEECSVELTADRYNTSTTKCLDHDHSILDRENVRNILCNACNLKRG